MIDATAATPRAAERITVEDAALRYIDHLQDVKNRKPTTISDYRYIVRAHVASFFAGRSIDSITDADVEQYMKAKLAAPDDDRATRLRTGRLTAKTINNHLNFLHGVFEHATNSRRKWATSNPVRGLDRPGAAATDGRFAFSRRRISKRCCERFPMTRSAPSAVFCA